MVPADSRRIPRAPRYSGYRYAMFCFVYRTFTSYGCSFQNILLTKHIQYRGPTTPPMPKQRRFGLFPGRSPLLGESLLFSLPGGTKMFQFPPLASLRIVRITPLQGVGLSHSETPGSKVICTYPGLIAACHVLHRLREPRHPPCALDYFRL